ncbi:MAG TPA: AmmeMemoRadiSam system protein B [Terriglobales bacterium]
MIRTAIRPAAVAGKFYPREPAALTSELKTFLNPAVAPTPAIGCIAPHAGYVYSGAVAGAVYSAIDVPARCIVLCPNHTGQGVPLSIMEHGLWETPLGAARIDTPLALALRTRFPILAQDSAAHRSEHAIEVQLPFLETRHPGLTFVPIAIGINHYETQRALGEAIADVLASQPDKILIVASSDMNHYESDSITRIKDHKAIDRILALDPRGLFDVVTREDISMCGFGPAVAMLTAAVKLGATSAELIRYATSGDVSGDRDLVVGYAGIVIR